MRESERKLAPGERRFEAKVFRQLGRGKFEWGVYDRQVASWPGQRPELGGPIKQRVPEDVARAEADRLEGMRNPVDGRRDPGEH